MVRPASSDFWKASLEIQIWKRQMKKTSLPVDVHDAQKRLCLQRNRTHIKYQKHHKGSNWA